jgi:hypothetical protein
MITAILARRRILLAKQSGNAPDMVLLINSQNAGDFSVTTRYGTFTAVKVSDYPYFNTTVTHKLSMSNVTFSAGISLSNISTVRNLFVGVESWGTSNTYTNTSYLFNGCSNLRGIPSSWDGLGAVTNASIMFGYCTSLLSIPASWDGLGAVTNASIMFGYCTSLLSIPASWAGLVELTNAEEMFRGCTSLTSIPASWEGLGAVTNASKMFRECNSLTNCGTIFTGLAKVTNVSGLFYFCTGMRGDIHALYVYLSTKSISVISYSYCFYFCERAVGYSSIPASWR